MKRSEIFMSSFLGVFCAVFVLDFLNIVDSLLIRSFVFGIVVFFSMIILLMKEKKND